MIARFCMVVLVPLVALATAEDIETEMCSSLLQTGSSIHEAHDHGNSFLHDEVHGKAHTGHHKPLTLLQVAARTGEVSQYAPAQQDEDSEKSDHAASNPEKHHNIASLLSRGAESVDGVSEKAAVHGDSASDGANPVIEDKVGHGHEAEAEEDPDKKQGAVVQGARIAPFGKEDTSRELQHHAARTQDTLVDAIENAEVAEIKRSIFRSLTRLRAAEIKEFDTIARLETQAIDEYNDNHHYRKENPLDYIHGAEVAVKEDKYTSFHD